MAAKARRAKRNFYGAILEKSVLIKKQTIVNAFFASFTSDIKAMIPGLIEAQIQVYD